MSTLVETRHLKKYFKVSKGMLHAVDDVDLTIEEGETLGVVGESGCGSQHWGGLSCVFMNRPPAKCSIRARIF